MRSLKSLLFGMSLLLVSTLTAFGADAVWTLPIRVDGTGLTETPVAISSITRTTLLAANPDRIAFDIQIATCATPAGTSTKIWYAYDGTVSSGTPTTSSWLDTGGAEVENWLVQPRGIVYTGIVKAIADKNGCVAVVREWELTSQKYK